MENAMFGAAGAIEQGIVGQANFLGGLATAIAGGIFAIRLQMRLKGGVDLCVRWAWAFWFATVFSGISIALVLVISGMMIELAPILFNFEFDATEEFSSQKFGDLRIEELRLCGIGQMVSFVLLVFFAGAFAVRNFSR